MSDGSDFDDDIDKILNDLGSFDKKMDKEDIKISRVNNPQPELQSKLGKIDLNENDNFNKNKPTRIPPPPLQPQSPIMNQRFSNSSQNNELKGNPLLASLFTDNSSSTKNKQSPAELTKPFPTSLTKTGADNTIIEKSTATTTTTTTKGNSSLDWLGLGPTTSPPIIQKKGVRSFEINKHLNDDDDDDDDGEDDILRTLRRSGGENPIKQKAEKPLKTPAAAAVPSSSIRNDDDSYLLEKLNVAKKIQQQQSSSSSEQQHKGGSFEDKLPKAHNLTKGPSLFENKFAFNNNNNPSPSPTSTPPFKQQHQQQQQFFPSTTTTTPPPISVQIPGVGGITPNENERKSFLNSLFGNSSPSVRNEQQQVLDTQKLQGSSVETSLPKKKSGTTPSTAAVVVKKQQQQPISSRSKENVVNTGTGSDKNSSIGNKTTTTTTLQVASHLIDEDELKSMSSSLKTLYTNQLDMMEKSYTEQMVCMTQSHLRKEDMLKEEIRMIHKDYESRLERLKNELMEVETRSLQTKYHQKQDSDTGILYITEQMKLIQNQIESIKLFPFESTNTNNANTNSYSQQSTVPIQTINKNPAQQIPNISEQKIINSIVSTEIEQIIETKFNNFEKSLMKTIEDKLEMTTKNVNVPNLESLRPDIKDISIQINKLDKKRRNEIAKFGNLVVEGTANNLSSIILKLSEVQKKIGENLEKKILTSLTQTIETNQHQQQQHEQRSVKNIKNKDKIFIQIKEFREDLHRFSLDVENRNDIIQKSQAALDFEQKQITQNFQDLNSWLQIYFTKNSLQIETQPNFQNYTSSSSQTELEIQLLKEERKNMSESIAQIHVERKKLNDEKFLFEKEKREIVKERNRIQELQMNLQMKLSDVEDMQKECETSRQENYRLGGEIVRQQNEIEKDRLRQKESLRSIEENLKLQQENILHEKMDILKEKEFFEKLRNQLLCPGCLKSLTNNQSLGIITIQQQNYHEPRTIGDGLEKPIIMTGTGTGTAAGIQRKHIFQTNPIRINNINDDNLVKEMKFLDDLYLRGYSKL